MSENRERVYPPVIRTALGLFRLLDIRFTIEGVENIPASGGAVLASNHVSYLDFMFVGLAAHRRGRLVRFMAKQAVFHNPLSGPLMRGMHHIPVDRTQGLPAYHLAVDALRSGELVGVFPESTISPTFEPMAFKTGAVRMAAEAGVPLLPVAVWGGQQVWTKGSRPKLRRHVPLRITVGAPLRPDTEGAAASTAALQDAVRGLVRAASSGAQSTEQ